MNYSIQIDEAALVDLELLPGEDSPLALALIGFLEREPKPPEAMLVPDSTLPGGFGYILDAGSFQIHYLIYEAARVVRIVAVIRIMPEN